VHKAAYIRKSGLSPLGKPADLLSTSLSGPRLTPIIARPMKDVVSPYRSTKDGAALITPNNAQRRDCV
jgi:hypothetical protein